MKGKITLLAIVVFAFASSLRAGDKNPADYPIKLVLLKTRWSTNRWGVHGMGRGRISDDGQVNGIEFTYDCADRLTVSYNSEFYPGKWRKQPNEMTVLLQNIGDDGHLKTCDLKMDVHNFIYVRKGGHLSTVSQQEWAATHASGARHPDDDVPPPQN